MAEIVRLVNPNGTVVTCDEQTAAKLGSEWKPVDGSGRKASTKTAPSKKAAAQPEGYAAQKVADLKDEIDRRNEGRADEDLIPADGNKAALVAALEADDAASASSNE